MLGEGGFRAGQGMDTLKQWEHLPGWDRQWDNGQVSWTRVTHSGKETAVGWGELESRESLDLEKL